MPQPRGSWRTGDWPAGEGEEEGGQEKGRRGEGKSPSLRALGAGRMRRAELSEFRKTRVWSSEGLGEARR